VGYPAFDKLYVRITHLFRDISQLGLEVPKAFIFIEQASLIRKDYNLISDIIIGIGRRPISRTLWRASRPNAGELRGREIANRVDAWRECAFRAS
jgi:hypothetical protein